MAMLVYQRVILDNDNDNDYDNDIVTMIMILFYEHHHCCCHHTQRERGSERVRKFFQLYNLQRLSSILCKHKFELIYTPGN